MNAKRFINITAALLAALLVITACACGRKGEEPKEGSEDNIVTLAPTEAPTPEPTEEPTPEPIIDYARFDKPLGNICRFIEAPGPDTAAALYPEDFFNGLKSMIETVMATAGMTYENLGYEDFDDLVQGMLEEMDFNGYVGTQGIEHVEQAEYEILGCERAEVSFVAEQLADFIDYLDEDKITSAYKLECDFIFHGDGRTASNDAELYLYEYEGEFYVLFA